MYINVYMRTAGGLGSISSLQSNLDWNSLCLRALHSFQPQVTTTSKFGRIFKTNLLDFFSSHFKLDLIKCSQTPLITIFSKTSLRTGSVPFAENQSRKGIFPFIRYPWLLNIISNIFVISVTTDILGYLQYAETCIQKYLRVEFERDLLNSSDNSSLRLHLKKNKYLATL